MLPAAVLTAVAIAGWLASLGIPRVRAGAAPTSRVPRNPIARDVEATAACWLVQTADADRPGDRLLLSSGDPDAGQRQALRRKRAATERTATPAYLMLALVVGVGLGSVLAGIWSGGRVELGIVPLGAIGIVVMSVGLFRGRQYRRAGKRLAAAPSLFPDARRPASSWGSPPGCSMFRSKRSCSTAVRGKSAARCWPPATSSPSPASSRPRNPVTSCRMCCT